MKNFSPILHSIAIILFFFLYIKLLMLFYNALQMHKIIDEKTFLVIIKGLGIALLLIYSHAKKIIIFTKIQLKAIPHIIPLLLFEIFLFYTLNIKLDLNQLITFSIPIFVNVSVEEIIFRGMILFLFIQFFIKKNKNFLLYSCLGSSIIFGASHLLNFFSNEIHLNTRSIINQIYASTAIGFLFCLIYLKTQNLLYILLFHFSHNLFASLENIDNTINMDSNNDSNYIALIISEILKFSFFSIPLIVGLFYYHFFIKNDKVLNSKELYNSG